MKIVKTNNSNKDFVELTSKLDAELNERYGSKQLEYDKHNQIDPIETAIIGYLNGEAIALYKKCGYQSIENYGPYKDLENSVCMEKTI